MEAGLNTGRVVAPDTAPHPQRRAVRRHGRLRRRLQLPLRRLHLRAQRPAGDRLPAAGGGLGLVPAPPLAASLLYLAALAVFGLFVAWTGLSVLWSFGPDLSWIAFDLAALYLVVAAVLGLTPVRGLQLRVAGYGFLVVAVAVGVYAFLGKVVPDVVTHAHTYARLDSPIGYWNVLALMMVMGLTVALALAGDRTAHPAWRVLAAAAAVPLSFTFFFTLSRGGWVALAVIAGRCTSPSRRRAWPASRASWPSRPRWRPCSGASRDLGTLFTRDHGRRPAHAPGPHAAALVARRRCSSRSAAQAAVVLVQRAVPWPRWVRVAAGAAVLVVLVAGDRRRLVALPREPRRHGLGEGPRAHLRRRHRRDRRRRRDRPADLAQHRPAAAVARGARSSRASHRLRGTGAGTFVFTHDRFRDDGGVVKHAHSQWFNVLSELGVVGLGLFVAAMVAVRGGRRAQPVRRPARPPAPARSWRCRRAWSPSSSTSPGTGTGTWRRSASCSSCSPPPARRTWRPGAADGRRAGATSRRRAATRGAGGRGAGRRDGRPRRPADAGSPGAGPAAALAAAPGRSRRGGRRSALVLLAVELALPYLVGAGRERGARRRRRRRHRRRPEPARAAPRASTRWPCDPLITEALVLQQQGRNGEALAALARGGSGCSPTTTRCTTSEGVLLLQRVRAQEGRHRRAAARARPEPARRGQSLTSWSRPSAG